MLLEIIGAMILGIIAGSITGLIPGLHVNMIAALILTLLLQYTFDVEMILIGVFIVALGITHTFISFIPSLFLGVPTPDTVVSMLPGHELVSQGRGFEALKLTAWGSLGGVLLLGVFYILAYLFILPYYEQFSSYIGKFLLAVLIYIILKEDSLNAKFWAIIIVLLSGGFGLIVLNSIHIQNPLFLVFTGMFGTATLLIALIQQSEFTPQDIDIVTPFKISYLGGIFLGGVSAMLCSIAPGLGNAQAGTIVMNIMRKVNAQMMIVVLSAINTVNFGLSILTLYVLERARNGAIIIFQQLEFTITLQVLILLFIIMILTGLIAYDLVFVLGKRVIGFVEYISTAKLNASIAFILTFIIALISNWSEFLAYIASICLGVLCVQVGVRRVHLMAVLLVPIIILLW